MAELYNLTQNTQILSHLDVPKTFLKKSRGLIGRKKLKPGYGMWLKKCKWIHTFFMSMPIDVIYIDKALKVTKIQHGLKPWRIPAPVFSAESVIEVAAGSLRQKNIHIGDQLNVGH